MEQHPIENMMRTTLENIRGMVDVNTIVGDAMETATGEMIIPISRVSFGFVAGGGEYGAGQPHPFAGGTGAGVSIRPVGFLVVAGERVRMLPIDYANPYDRIIEMVPQFAEQIRSWLAPDQADSQDGQEQQPPQG